jgi:Spherulation-specific family 4
LPTAGRAPPPNPETGILIPLYIYPGPKWGEVAGIARANPKVPIVAIINPDSGPGTRVDPSYSAGISGLKSAGVTVLGYTWTGYASRDVSDVKSSIRAYKDWYDVDGIFLDEMSNVPGKEAYYSVLDDYIRSLGLGITIGNPGTDVPASYIGAVDTLVIHEGPGFPDLSRLRNRHSNHDKGNFAMIAYGVHTIDPSSISAAAPNVGYVYVTDAGLPNPYGALPPYLGAIAAALGAAAETPERRDGFSARAARALRRLRQGMD